MVTVEQKMLCVIAKTLGIDYDDVASGALIINGICTTWQDLADVLRVLEEVFSIDTLDGLAVEAMTVGDMVAHIQKTGKT